MAQGELPRTRMSAESGMSTLMDMANGFVNDLVQSTTIGDFMDDNNVKKFDDFNDIELQEYALFLIGFAVCVGIGVLLAIIMPFSGCIVGCSQCCQCCCSCCGGRHKYRKDSRSEEYGCAVSLLVFAGILLAAVTCAFVATEMYRRELDPKTGTLDDVLQGLLATERYIDDSLVDLNDSVIGGMAETKEDVFNIIDILPEETKNMLGIVTNVKPPLDSLYVFTSGMDDMTDALDGMKSKSSNLVDSVDALGTKFAESAIRITDELVEKGCPEQYEELCLRVQSDAEELKPCVDFSNVDGVNDARNAVEGAKGSGVDIIVDSGVFAFDLIADKVEEELEDQLDVLKDNINDIESEVVKVIDDLANEINSIDLTDVTDGVIDAKPYFEEYGFYVYWAFLGMNIVMLLIVVLMIIGATVGLVCPFRTNDSGSCDGTKVHGAKILTAASSFVFIFSWVLVIIIIVLFLGGGGIEAMGCRHIITYDSTMQQLEQLLWAEIRENNQDLTYNISFHQAMLDCKADRSLYVAAAVEQNGFNVTEILDLDQYGIEDIIEKVKNTTIELEDIDFRTEDIRETMADVDIGMDTLDLDTYQAELDKNVVCIDVSLYARDVLELSEVIDSEIMFQESEALVILAENDIPSIEDEMKELQIDVDTVREIYPSALEGNVDELATAEEKLNANANKLIQDQIDIYSDKMYGHIKNFTSDIEYSIRYDIGQCRGLYDGWVVAVYGPCVYFLDAVNALWFCYGWFLIFSIPAVILAIQLGNIFSRFEQVEEETDGMEYGTEHYPLYYKSQGTTQHYGLHSGKIHPAYDPETMITSGVDPGQSHSGLRNNKVTPLDQV